MGSLINFSLNLDKLNKAKVVKGKNGNYYDLTISVNDETNQFGHNVSVFDRQTKEERDAKSTKNYVANGKVVWTDGAVTVAKDQAVTTAPKAQVLQDDDFPF